MRYRENASTKELSLLLRELAMIDAYYKRCEEMDIHLESLDAVDQMDELRKAALNHRGQP